MGKRKSKDIGEGICYVCKKVIKKGVVKLLHSLQRHKTCEPGSVKWMKSEVGMSSPLRKYFEAGYREVPVTKPLK